MFKVPNIEACIGIEVYASKSHGIGGAIKCSPEDFIVEEILTNGSKASIKLENNRLNSLTKHGRYLICVLVKRGWDTLLAIEELARSIGVSADRISFAGIKDTDALTAQYISVGGIPLSKIKEISIKNLFIKPLGFSSEEITPEKLFGNKFTIRVRSIKLKEATLRRRIKKISGELADFGGIPNFFGHQRFGTIRPITHIVGKHIIKGDFRKAVLTFLFYESPFESERAREARKELSETMNFKAALRSLPRSLVYERLILTHLSRSPNDFIGALHKIPINLRRLFVQAYQSYLFNRFLSERIKRKLSLTEVLAGDYLVKLDSLGLPTRKFVRAEASNLHHFNEEIRKGKVALAMPLIGLKQSPSEGLQGEIEREILEKEGISREDFRNPWKIKVNVLGGLRPVLAKIIDLKMSVTEDENDPSRKSVKFVFTLHKGTYATILLREFMKPSTDEQLIKSGF